MRSSASQEAFLQNLKKDGKWEEAVDLLENCDFTNDLSHDLIEELVNENCLDTCQDYKRRINNDFLGATRILLFRIELNIF